MPRPGGSDPPSSDGGAALDVEPAIPADDAYVSLVDDIAAERSRSVLAALRTDLIGLDSVKARVEQIAALLLVDRARAHFGLTSARPSLHMSFTGPPGTGKTTVAMRMAEMLHALGYLPSARVHAVTRDDLVGQFIGHTAPKTKEALARAAGGVLFIDEAYYLYRPDNERDYGQEAIEILLQEMESERASLVVIFAGYEDRMETFFASNPGLSSRVAHHIQFEDYTQPELRSIADLMVAAADYRFTAEARAAFGEYVELRMAAPRFANARSVRNALDRARLRHANRLVQAAEPLGRDDLMTITEADVRGSSVFRRADPAAG